MKRTSTFKLSKTTKRRMATIPNDAARHLYKNMMIDAQLAAEEASKRNSRSSKTED